MTQREPNGPGPRAAGQEAGQDRGPVPGVDFDPRVQIVADFDEALGTEQAREEARREGRDPLAGIEGRYLPIEGWPIPPGTRYPE